MPRTLPATSTQVSHQLAMSSVGSCQGSFSSSKPTVLHPLWVRKQRLHLRVWRQQGSIDRRRLVAQPRGHVGAGVAGDVVQVVRRRHAAAVRDLVHLVFAVAVEGGPLERLGPADPVPVVSHAVLAGVAHREPPALMRAREADDQRAEVRVIAGCVDVRLEESRWPFVYLQPRGARLTLARYADTSPSLSHSR